VLRIRLQRVGRKNYPFYRLVIAEHQAPVKGGYLELLGHYNPAVQPKVLDFKQEKILEWIKKGAQPSETVAALLFKGGMKEMEKFIKPVDLTKKSPKKKEQGKENSNTAVAVTEVAAVVSKEEVVVVPKEEAIIAPKEETVAVPKEEVATPKEEVKPETSQPS